MFDDDPRGRSPPKFRGDLSPPGMAAAASAGRLDRMRGERGGREPEPERLLPREREREEFFRDRRVSQATIIHPETIKKPPLFFLLNKLIGKLD